jgi:capsule polysaccharide export protein KpsE/RkpR
MSRAMEQIVDAYVRLGNRRALEDLRMHRQRLAVDLKGRAGYDFSLPIGQIDQELAVIEAGLDKLNAADCDHPDDSGLAEKTTFRTMS